MLDARQKRQLSSCQSSLCQTYWYFLWLRNIWIWCAYSENACVEKLKAFMTTGIHICICMYIRMQHTHTHNEVSRWCVYRFWRRYPSQANFIYEPYVRARGDFPRHREYDYALADITVNNISACTYIHLLRNLISVTIIVNECLYDEWMRTTRRDTGNRIKSDSWRMDIYEIVCKR